MLSLYMKIIHYILSLAVASLIFTIEAHGTSVKSDYPYAEAEKYISKILEKPIPYSKQILNVTWTINDHQTYPAGSLTQLFASYLMDNNLIQDKIVADIGSSGFTIGVLAAKNGAKEVVGTCITPESAKNARENIASNHVEEITQVLDGSGADPLLPKYKGKVDVIVSGPPWNTISKEDINNVPESRKALSRLFYDTDDRIINNVLSKAPELLAPEGKIYMTASLKIMERVKSLCRTSHMSYKIVQEKDIHHDGNIHYILMLTPEK